MLRNPDISATHVVFVYADDLWLVPREGGVATPLASPPGQETFPRFSPDGKTIAFVGNYEGNQDIYTIPTAGGPARRVTHHPAGETVCEWMPDGRILFFSPAVSTRRGTAHLYTVPPEGGLPTMLPVPYGANGAISPDGRWLAYTFNTRDHRTWKRYRGGMATDIWLFDLVEHGARKITDWEGTDSQPMWHGPNVYYLSDAGPEHRLNIWTVNTRVGGRRQMTHFTEYDAKWPAIGPGDHGQGEIVFHCGARLFVLDVQTAQTRELTVTIPGDRPQLRDRSVNAAGFIHSIDVSPAGQRAVFEARGDIWTLPARHGSPRNLTRTDGARERYPAWSPDGRWIAYFSDAEGEYDLYLAQSDGKGDPRRLTQHGDSYWYFPVWSPDSKRLTFYQKDGTLFLHTIEGGETAVVDVDPWTQYPNPSWASDSNWIAYTKSGANQQTAIWLYNVADRSKQQLTSGMFNDTWPTFDREGKYLLFASNREFSSPIYADIDHSFVYSRTDRLYLAPLRTDLPSPWAPKSDEETWEDEEKSDEGAIDNGNDNASADDASNNDNAADHEDAAANDAAPDNDHAAGNDNSGNDNSADGEEVDEDKKDEKKPPEPVKIDVDGFERRAIPVPVDRGSYSRLSFNDKGHLLYVRGAVPATDGKSAVRILDPADEKKEEKTVLSDCGSYVPSADGRKLLVSSGGKYAVVDAAADQKMEHPIDTSGMSVQINPREEWEQIFNEAWRVQRDFFYDPTMHGVDWAAVRGRYAAMLADCNSRRDLTFVIGEMIAELNVGHAYVRESGDLDPQPSTSVGMLGADFALDQGAYKITAIYEGAPWDADARGPLSQPGVEVNVGDYLLAVNRVPLDVSKDPWAAFQGLAGATVTLTVSDKPAIDDDARDVVVTLIAGENDLRFRSWIEQNRRYVEGKTDGRVGYIYVPNTGVSGQNELFRQFFGQKDREALIIDERWNGGGQIPTRFIELLNRPVTNYWARRDGVDWTWPPDAHHGPKCMLINGLAGSGGDMFPALFRQAGLGKLIGTRTWGGLVGISGNPNLVDDGGVTAPTFAYYEKDGTWGIEGHGVDPDIEVIDDPSKMLDGGDPQLDAAIEHMLKELDTHPYVPPARPAYPDRAGMGVTEADK